MKQRVSFKRFAIAAVLLLASGSVRAGDVNVAVASNFAAAANALETSFEQKTDHEVRLVLGSTGKHYAQIRNGAPLDVLLAADERRPTLLEEEGSAIRGSRFTYARGRLVLWSAKSGYVDDEGLGLWRALERRIVRGENVAQALQFVDSGNAELGFIAASQLTAERRTEGSYWEIPRALYSPIEQQAVLLRDGLAARDFLEFLGSDEGIEIIIRSGYEVP